MQQVKFAWKDDQYKESERGVRISRWLKENGLRIGTDYTWMLDANNRELIFMFNSHAEAWASMLAVKET